VLMPRYKGLHGVVSGGVGVLADSLYPTWGNAIFHPRLVAAKGRAVSEASRAATTSSFLQPRLAVLDTSTPRLRSCLHGHNDGACPSHLLLNWRQTHELRQPERLARLGQSAPSRLAYSS